MGLVNARTFENPLASSLSVTGPTLLASIGPQKTAKNFPWPRFRGTISAGRCRSSIFFDAACALSSRSNRPTNKYIELVITALEPRLFEALDGCECEFFRTGPVSMRGKTSGATAGFAGSGAGAFACVTGAGFVASTFGFVASVLGSDALDSGSLDSVSEGSTGGGAGCSYAKSGGFGATGAAGGRICPAACTTPNQCNPVSAATTSSAPKNTHTNGDVRLGTGCGAVIARGTPVEIRFAVVFPVAGVRGGAVTGDAERKFDSRSTID